MSNINVFQKAIKSSWGICYTETLTVFYSSTKFYCLSFKKHWQYFLRYINTNKKHEKHFIHHSSNSDCRLVIRRICMECRRVDSYSYCTGNNFFIICYYSQSLVINFLFSLSHIHGPFYQQGYSSPL